ncbi:MAG: hypothetical protein JOZ15_09060 [Acidobacteria bacterium]|nr:hypothetical protein [Acidobacteriota bacterium]
MMGTETSPMGTLGGVPRALMNLLNAEVKLGLDMIESLTGLAVPDLKKLTGSLRHCGKCAGPCSCHCCKIPAPCWMPQPLCECVSHASECKEACIRLVVTNCGRVPRTIQFRATGPAGGSVKFSPPSPLTIDPMERAVVEACLAVPAHAKHGETFDSILWVNGCRQHFLRWTVSVGTHGLGSCHEVEVEDCPDLIHHWYDHFYCPRPCQG